jgi:hypothetical protein
VCDHPLLLATRQRHWKVACRHAARLRGAQVDPELVAAAVNAAIMAENAAAMRHAATLAVSAQITPELRASLAQRLVGAGQAVLGLAVMVADPAVFRRADTVSAEGVSLPAILRSAAQQLGTIEPALQRGVQAMARRLLNEETAEQVPSGFAFSATPDLPAHQRGSVRIHSAPSLSPALVAEASAALDQFERWIARAVPPSVQLLRDVFVNRRGQIWRADGRALRTFNSPIPPASLASMAAAPRLSQAALGIAAHNNTYHWLAEVLPSLGWCLETAGAPMPILIREDPAPFMRDSLVLASGATPHLVEVGDAIHVSELHFGSRNLSQLRHHAFFARTFARLAARALDVAPPIAAGQLIYISRSDSSKRPLANERELEATLERRGFSVMALTPMPFAAKVAAFARARLIVAPHGAGLAHLLYASPGTVVLEMVPAAPGSMTVRSCFARMSSVFGLDHHLWLDVPAEPTVASGWTLDLDAFMPVVDALLATRPG